MKSFCSDRNGRFGLSLCELLKMNMAKNEVRTTQILVKEGYWKRKQNVYFPKIYISKNISYSQKDKGSNVIVLTICLYLRVLNSTMWVSLCSYHLLTSHLTPFKLNPSLHWPRERKASTKVKNNVCMACCTSEGPGGHLRSWQSYLWLSMIFIVLLLPLSNSLFFLKYIQHIYTIFFM